MTEASDAIAPSRTLLPAALVVPARAGRWLFLPVPVTDSGVGNAPTAPHLPARP